MPKRFTATEKWDDPWFWELSPQAKLLWLFLCDHCDNAGIIELSLKLASQKIGLSVTEKHFCELQSRITAIDCGKYLVVGFIKFQYGKLSRDCKPHAPVFASLSKHRLDPEEIEQNYRFKNSVEDYIREKVIVRDGCSCVYTGKQLLPGEVVIDHVIPRSKGGSNKMENLVTTSKEINAEKWDKDLRTYCSEKGWDFNAIAQRVSKATMVASDRVQVQEKEKEKDKEPEQGVKEFPSELRTARVLNKWQVWMTHRRAHKKPKSWLSLFNEQVEWLSKFSEPEVFEILSASIRNGWQGLFEPKKEIPVNGRALSPFDYKTIIQAKQTQADSIKNKFCSETAIDQVWASEPKRQEYITLRREIKDLTAKLGAYGT